jgi:hypothetical protein
MIASSNNSYYGMQSGREKLDLIIIAPERLGEVTDAYIQRLQTEFNLRGFVFAKYLTRKSSQEQYRRIKVHSPFPLLHFQVPSHPIPSLHVYSESDVFPISDVFQSGSRSGRPAEAGFVFLKLRNDVAAHKNPQDAPPDRMQSYAMPLPMD